MIPITPDKINQYLHHLAQAYDNPVALAMEGYGHENNFPIIDRLVGVLIMTLAKIAGAKTVFEMGSGYGYSAYWFAQGIGPQGRILCTDGNPKNEEKAREFLKQTPYWKQIQYHIGDALETLKHKPGPYDILYCDIDKGDYPQAWEIAKTQLRPGGLYICDNTLWSGRVAESEVTDDIRQGWTEAIRDHNHRVYADKNFDVTLIPLRDGVLIARKKD